MAQSSISRPVPNGSEARSAFGGLLGRDRTVLDSAPRTSFGQDCALQPSQFRETPVLILLRGAIGLRHDLRDGRRSISAIFLPGDVMDFRYMNVKDSTLSCLSPVEVCYFEAALFDQWQATSATVRAILDKNHYQLRESMACHCADLARKTAVEKLASFIFECHGRQKGGADGDVPLILKRIDIADYIGLRPETLSRAFAKLRQQGLIEFQNLDRIHILDEEALRQIAEGAATDLGPDS